MPSDDLFERIALKIEERGFVYARMMEWEDEAEYLRRSIPFLPEDSDIAAEAREVYQAIGSRR